MKKMLSMLMGLALSVSMLGSVCAAEDSYTFAVVYPIVHPFFEGTTRGAEDKAAELGNVEMIFKAPDVSDASIQIDMVESLIAMGVDGIAIGATDGAALAPVIDKAMESGIKVVTFDTDSEASTRLGYIGTDNVNAGKHMGEILGRVLEGKGKVIVSQGISTQENLVQRLEGVKEVIAEKYPEIEIIDEKSGQGDSNTTIANIENMVTANPDFDALIGIDALAGPSAAVVWNAQGLDKPVITFDDLDDIIQGVRDGKITVTIAQNQYDWGTNIVEQLIAACNGEEIPEFTDCGTREVTIDNVAELYPE